MRDHYAGDLSDLIKFSLLCALSDDKHRLGVAWYYVSSADNLVDGQHLAWKTESRWVVLDKNVHQQLSGLRQRRVKQLQELTFWPKGTTFHTDPLDLAVSRSEWVASKRSQMAGSSIVFLDPDNGLSDHPTSKYATYEEVRHLLALGKTVVFITFPKRTTHDKQVLHLHESLAAKTAARRIFTLRVSVSIRNKKNNGFVPTFRWFTLLNPDAMTLERMKAYSEILCCIDKVRVRQDEFVA